MLKIAHLTNVIDGRTNSGTARVASQLIKELSTQPNIHQYLIHFEPSNHEIYTLPKTTEILIPLRGARYGHHFRSFIRFWTEYRFKNHGVNFDVVHWHSSRVFPFFFIIPSKKIVVTLHDAGTRILKGVNTFSTQIFYWNLRIFINYVDCLLAVSQTAAKDLVEVGKFPRKLVNFNYNGSKFGQLESQMVSDAETPFILCVSRWQNFKNVESLVKGYAFALEESKSNIPRLILVGKPVSGYDLPARTIQELKLENHVVVLKDISDQELAYLLDRAWLNIVPSLHEGFGLIVLEGLARGCTPVVHKFTATAEIAGECGIQIDMRLPREIAQVITESGPRERDKELLCKTRAEQFTWANAANKIMAIYTDLLSNSQRT